MKSFRSHYNDDNSIYKSSLECSYKEMNSRPNFYDISYISREEISRFKDEKSIYDGFHISRVLLNDDCDNSQLRINIRARFDGICYGIDDVDSKTSDQSIYDDCKNVIDWIKSDANSLNSYDKLYEGDYFTIKMPMYSGVIVHEENEKKIYVKYWFGYYRDLKLFLIEDLNEESPVKLSKDDFNNYKYCLEKNLDKKFTLLYNHLKDKIRDKELTIDFTYDFKDDSQKKMRIDDVKFGWVEMLIRCDKYKVDDFGLIEISGTPIIISRFMWPGYGRYEVTGNINDKDCMYYEFNGKEFTGNILKYEKSRDPVKKDFDLDINYLRYRFEFPKISSSFKQKDSLNTYEYEIVNESIGGQDILAKKIRSCNNLKAFVLSKTLLYDK